ncbi:MAG: sigma-70 family RNA polymerase sigma factor [Bacteroidota bacterium]
MNVIPTNEKALIKAIKSGGSDRQRAIRMIYDDKELRSKVIHYVRTHGGNAADGQDMYQEGIIVLDRNIREGKFREETSLKGYLYSICRFLWMNQARKQAKTTLTSESTTFDGKSEFTPESAYFETERKKLLQLVLNRMEDRCRRILKMWQLSYSMSEIATEMGLANDTQARKAKYRCHQSLMKLIQAHPGIAQQLENLRK